MIYLILGSNAYVAEQELAAIAKKLDVTPERVDVAALTDNSLADIMRGGSLFAQKRLVVASQLSDSRTLWAKAAEWASTMTSDTTLVLIETKPDRRTKAYKALAAVGKVITADPWTEYEAPKAEEWLRNLAKQNSVNLTQTQVKDMVVRAYVASPASSSRVVDQFQLAQAIAALRSLDDVTDEAIATVLPPATPDTLFDLLEAAVRHDAARTKRLLDDIRHSEDPYMALAVILGQWAQLAAISFADGPPATIATELGIHPFVAKKLQALTRELSRADVTTFTHLAASLDAGSKRSKFSPWDGLERFLYGLALR